jgi:hypothetical protein
MLGDMTHEEWTDWLNAFQQDPWDEARKDDRNAVNALWGIAPYLKEDDLKLPGFHGPEYSAEKDNDEAFTASVARLKAAKQRYLDGQLHSKTSDPANH